MGDSTTIDHCFVYSNFLIFNRMEEEYPSKPPPKKGFKGKRGRPKFTRTLRTGAEQKSSIIPQVYRDVSQPTPVCKAPFIPMILNSRAASRKCNKRDLEQSLGGAMTEVASARREVARISQRELALRKRHNNLRKIVKDVRINLCSARKDILQVQAEKLQLENDLHGQIGGFDLVLRQAIDLSAEKSKVTLSVLLLCMHYLNLFLNDYWITCSSTNMLFVLAPPQLCHQTKQTGMCLSCKIYAGGPREINFTLNM